MKIRTWILLFALAGLTSCATGINNQIEKANPEDSNELAGILFLTIGAEKQENQLVFKIQNAQTTPGILKKRADHIPAGSKQWLVEFLDTDNKVIKKLFVENALDKSVEVSNEEGRFERQQISLDKATFVIRVDYTRSMSKLRLSDSAGQVLSILDLESESDL